ncbi:MAG: LEA type 2 family protein [Sulfolobales archaeon]
MVKKILLVILALVIIGLSIWIYQGYTIAKSLSLENYSIVGTNVKELYKVAGIPIPLPRIVSITFKLSLMNPTNHSIEINDVTYHIYVNGTYLGSGSRSDIKIWPGKQSISLDVDIDLAKVFDLVKLYSTHMTNILRGEKGPVAEIIIRGDIKIPITLNLMVAEVKTPIVVSIPYEVIYYYEIFSIK